jgi:hypothetical protein
LQTYRAEEQQVIMIKVLLCLRYFHDFKRKQFLLYSIYVFPYPQHKHDDQNLVSMAVLAEEKVHGNLFTIMLLLC